MFYVYSLMAFVVVLLVGGVVYYQVGRTIEQNVGNELSNATTAILNMVKTTAKASIKNYLRAVAEKNRDLVADHYAAVVSGRMTEAQAKARLREIFFSQTIGKTGYIYCIDSSGIAVEHPRPAVVGVNYSEFQFIREQIRRKEGYLEYEWKNPGEASARPKALYMTFFEPWDWIISVTTYREEFRELINISEFKDSILSLSFGKTGYSYVVDSKGNVVVHPFLTGNMWDVRDADGIYLVRHQSETKNGKLIYKWRNPGESRFRDKIVIYNHIPDYDWIVASTGYIEEFYAPLKSLRNIVLTTVFIILVLVLPTTFTIARGITRPLRQLETNLSQAMEGNFAGRMARTGGDEVGKLAAYFNRFMERLEQYSRLEMEVIETSERERRQLGQYLHDDLCSHLLGIEVMQKIQRRKLAAIGYADLSTIDKICDLVQDAITKASRISRGLCPTNIADQGLELTLKALCRDISDIYGVSCRLTYDTETYLPDHKVATHIYYIAREAAYNAVKHGNAANIVLTLSRANDSATLTIHDDGKGLPDHPTGGGMGIRIMHYRASRIGAILDMRRDGSAGSVVNLTFRVPEATTRQPDSEEATDDVYSQ